MSPRRVYLAGPVAGLSYGNATDWRNAAAAMLAPDIEAVSPLRGQEFLSGLGPLGARPDEPYMAHPMSTPKALASRCRYDVTKADAVLLYLRGATRVSIGSMIEAGWADAHRVPVVLVCEEGNVHWHAILVEIVSYVMPTLEEGVAVVRSLLGAPQFRSALPTGSWVPCHDR